MPAFFCAVRAGRFSRNNTKGQKAIVEKVSVFQPNPRYPREIIPRAPVYLSANIF